LHFNNDASFNCSPIKGIKGQLTGVGRFFWAGVTPPLRGFSEIFHEWTTDCVVTHLIFSELGPRVSLPSQDNWLPDDCQSQLSAFQVTYSVMRLKSSNELV
jgi:hypothetical protein